MKEQKEVNKSNGTQLNIAKPYVISEAKKRIGNFVTALVKRVGIEVSTDIEELERVIREYLPEEVRADIDMIDEVEKENPTSTAENLLQKQATLSGNRISSAKIDINNYNRALIKGKLSDISYKLNNGISISDGAFLILIQEAFENFGISGVTTPDEDLVKLVG